MEEFHSPSKTLEYNYIDQGIYIGTNVCCQTHFNKELKNIGIEADISLEAVQVDKPFGVNFYIWLPVEVNQAPSVDQLEFGIATIEKLIKMNKKIYVHCQNGHSRAPTLVIAYLVKNGKSIDQAIDFVKQKRPAVHLHEPQIIALKNFQKNLS